MRMWMIPPELMCRKHLLGEHVELHMLVGCILKGKSIEGYIENNLVFPKMIIFRHTKIVKEMIKRGYKHNSNIQEKPLYEIVLDSNKPYFYDNFFIFTMDDIVNKNLNDLASRCPECAERINKYRSGL